MILGKESSKFIFEFRGRGAGGHKDVRAGPHIVLADISICQITSTPFCIYKLDLGSFSLEIKEATNLCHK